MAKFGNRLFAALCSTALLVACADSPIPTEQVPQFDWANGPDNPGIVMRDSWDGYAFWFPDDKTGWSVSLGWDMVEACSGTFERDVVHWTDKLLPGEEPRLVTLNRMDGARTQVWPFKVNDCDLFTTVPPLASGISELRVFDNDWTEDPTESSPRPNANVWGWMVHGTLAWTADGSAARFSFTQWTVWHKEGSKLSAEPVMQKLMLK